MKAYRIINGKLDGFYDTEIHNILDVENNALIDGYYEISENKYQSLFDGQANGLDIIAVDNELILQDNRKPYKPSYETLVEQRIRQKYTMSDELAIHRQRDTKPQEWTEYNAYCEECKRLAKEVIANE